MARRRGPLEQPAFRRLWTSRLLSNAGSYVQLTAVAWLVLREDGGPAHLGLVMAIATLPAALFVLEGGALADRYPARPFVEITTVLLAVNAVTLTVVESLEGLTLWEISAGAAISGTLGALSAPSTMRLNHLAVNEDDLPAANSLFSIEFNLARLAGPAIGGLLIAAGAPGLCFAANAASYLVFALVVAWIPLRKQPGPPRGLSLRTGLRAVRRVSTLATVTAVLGPIGLLGMNLSVFAPIVAHDVLDLGAVGFGLVTSAAGAGALLAGVVLVRLNRAGVKLFLEGALALAVGLILVAVSRETVVALTGFFVFGIGLTTTLASARTLFQRLAPPEAEGTALGVYNLLVVGTTPLGSVLVGALTSAAGIRATLAGLGAACVVTTAAGLTVARRRRQLDVEVRRGAVTAVR